MDPEDLRDLFNKLYLDRYNRGEFIEEVIEKNSPHPRSGQPPGTKSQRVRLQDRETQRVVAIIHRFRLYTGELGGSGNPDPKRVWSDGQWYWAPKEFPRVRGEHGSR